MRLDHVVAGVMTGSTGMDSPADIFLPAEVTQVSKEAVRAFSHSKRVGNYLLGRTLGEGSFAKVKEGLHVLTGEKVAVKVIDKKKAKEDVYVRKNLRREGKLLQLVRHPNVIQLLEIMETQHCYYLVTEFCQGGDLMELICSNKRLQEDTVRRYVRQIVSSIDFLHKAGILHRDLKVENLLLDEKKDIKIIDFGLSNAVRVSPTKEGSQAQEFCVTQCGSPAYAAPELLGNKKYGPKVDIWSIGVNMFAMLTGSLPYTVEPFNIKVLHNKMLSGDMNPLPEHLTKDCVDLIKRFLTADPESRITLSEAMQHPWLTMDGQDPMQAAPFPNKLSSDSLDYNIVKHMSINMDYRMSEVIRLVTKNIPNNATATYQLFTKKLTRYNEVMKKKKKRPASRVQTPSSSKQTFSRKSVSDSRSSTRPMSARVRKDDSTAKRLMTKKTAELNDRHTSKRQPSTSSASTDEDRAARAAENKLVRRRIQNARILARMQEEDNQSASKADDESDADFEDDETQEAQSEDEGETSHGKPESQESGIGTGTDSLLNDIAPDFKEAIPTSDDEDTKHETSRVPPMLTPRAIVLDISSVVETPRLPNINPYAGLPGTGRSLAKQQTTYTLLSKRFQAGEPMFGAGYTLPNKFSFAKPNGEANNASQRDKNEEVLSPRSPRRNLYNRHFWQRTSQGKPIVNMVTLTTPRMESSQNKSPRNFYQGESPRLNSRLPNFSCGFTSHLSVNQLKAYHASSHGSATGAAVKHKPDLKNPHMELSITGARADFTLHPLLNRSMQKR